MTAVPLFALSQLTMVPTPIHRWDVPGVPSPFSVKVKRDDLTHCTMTGNKVKRRAPHIHAITCSLYHVLQSRKAEFLLADALDKECDCIVTFGGIHSNHARVMSLAARELGLDCVLFIQTHSEQVKTLHLIQYPTCHPFHCSLISHY